MSSTTLAVACVTGLAAITKKFVGRKNRLQPDYITRSEFHAAIDTTRDRIDDAAAALTQKIDLAQKEILGAVHHLAAKSEARLDAHESTLARLDERSRLTSP